VGSGTVDGLQRGAPTTFIIEAQGAKFKAYKAEGEKGRRGERETGR
jgi:hypothetical protein